LWGVGKTFFFFLCPLGRGCRLRTDPSANARQKGAIGVATAGIRMQSRIAT
jgi:hypothetical protein